MKHSMPELRLTMQLVILMKLSADLIKAVRVAPQNRELHKIMTEIKEEINQSIKVSNYSKTDH